MARRNPWESFAEEVNPWVDAPPGVQGMGVEGPLQGLLRAACGLFCQSVGMNLFPSSPQSDSERLAHQGVAHANRLLQAMLDVADDAPRLHLALGGLLRAILDAGFVTLYSHFGGQVAFDELEQSDMAYNARIKAGAFGDAEAELPSGQLPTGVLVARLLKLLEELDTPESIAVAEVVGEWSGFLYGAESHYGAHATVSALDRYLWEKDGKTLVVAEGWDPVAPGCGYCVVQKRCAVW